jgi:hypothetical protein
MSAAHEPAGTPLFATWQRREALIEAFNAAWLGGRRPAIDDYLPADPEGRRAVQVELVHADLECRLGAGEPARVEDSLRRYPELKDDPALVLDLAAAEYALRDR